MKNKVCPIKNENCNGSKCAWFVNKFDCCAVFLSATVAVFESPEAKATLRKLKGKKEK